MEFPPGRTEDLAELIRAYPLAWLITCGSTGFDATPLPLVAETDEAGEVTSLVGHCSRRNAQVAALREHPRAYALFMGPQGYISPAFVSKPGWLPTWNFAVAILELDISFEEEETPALVNRLVDAAEERRADPWKLDLDAQRVDLLMARIIGFRGKVIGKTVRMKLGQEEDLPTVRDIIAALEAGPLPEWMERLNADRLQPGG